MEKKTAETDLIIQIFDVPACLQQNFHGRVLSIQVFSEDEHYSVSADEHYRVTWSIENQLESEKI